MFSVAFNVFTALLSIIILKEYFSIFFIMKKTTIFSVIGFSAFFIWQLLNEINIFPAYINVIISIVLILSICVFAYEGSYIEKILFSVMLLALWMLMELIVGYIMELMGYSYINSAQIGSVLSEMLTLILIIILKIYFRNENIKDLPIKYDIMLLVNLIGSMYVVYNIFMKSISKNNVHLKESLVSSLVIFAINIITFKLYQGLSRQKELEKYNLVYEQQLNLCTQHMKEKENVMLEFRNARHDMKQQLIYLEHLLENNKSLEAEKYLKKMLEIPTMSNLGISRTDNIVVDALINAKFSLAQQFAIDFNIDIHIPIELPFSNADLSILLGNILDNAIEASSRLPESRRKIKIYICYDKNVLIITIINNYLGHLIRDSNGKLVSTKKDYQNHGIGLKSVEKIADKYHGSVVIETENDLFTIKIILCEIEIK